MFSYDVPSQMTFMRVLLESKWSHWTGTNTIISAYPKPNHGTVEHDDNMVWWSVGICAIVSHNLCEWTSSISTGDWSHSEVHLENHSQPFLHAWLFHALASKNIEDAEVRCRYDAFQLHWPHASKMHLDWTVKQWCIKSQNVDFFSQAYAIPIASF